MGGIIGIGFAAAVPWVNKPDDLVKSRHSGENRSPENF
jgi:hypothetical protein